jgi:hypothetical protein
MSQFSYKSFTSLINLTVFPFKVDIRLNYSRLKPKTSLHVKAAFLIFCFITFRQESEVDE